MEHRIRAADFLIYFLCAIQIGTMLGESFFRHNPFFAIWVTGGTPWIIVILVRKLDVWDLKQGPQ